MQPTRTSISLAENIGAAMTMEVKDDRNASDLSLWTAIEIVVVVFTLAYPLLLVGITVHLQNNHLFLLYLLPLPIMAALIVHYLQPTLSKSTHGKPRQNSPTAAQPVTYLSVVMSAAFGCLYVMLMMCTPLLLRQAYFELEDWSESSSLSEREVEASMAGENTSLADHGHGRHDSWLTKTSVLSLLKINLAVLFLGVLAREHFSAASIVANRDLIMRAVLDNLDIFNLASLLGEKDRSQERIVPKGSGLEIAILVSTSLAFIVPYVFTSELFRSNSSKRDNAGSFSFSGVFKKDAAQNSHAMKQLRNVRLAGMPIMQQITMAKVLCEMRQRPSKMAVLEGMTEKEQDVMKQRLLLAISPAALYVYSLLFVNVPFITIRVYVLVAKRVPQIEFLIKDSIGIAMAVLNIRAYWSSLVPQWLSDFLQASHTDAEARQSPNLSERGAADTVITLDEDSEPAQRVAPHDDQS